MVPGKHDLMKRLLSFWRLAARHDEIADLNLNRFIALV